MSLQAAAQHLASQGRGPDTTLVHMSPREVRSLQELAMAHGGSLSINPSTGLPEAGFLDNLLPTIIGGAAVALTGGAVTPLMAGLGVGGLEALRSGDVGKGLMAGLGAYGGAGLMGGLVGAGGSAVGEAAGDIAGRVGSGEHGLAANQAVAAQSPFSLAGEGVKSVFNNPKGISAGLSNLGSNISTGFGSSPLMKLGTTAAAAAAPMLMGSGQTQFQPAKTEEVPIYSYTPGAISPTPEPDVPRSIDYRKFVPGQTVSPQSQRFGVEQRYYNPMYTQTGTKTYAANKPEEDDGGFFGLFANGGTVEEMSQANSVGANTGYPQADIRGHAYATPWQTPVSQNMVTGTADTGINPITGEMAFAEGGAPIYNPKTQTYEVPAVETPTITGQSAEEKRLADIAEGGGGGGGGNSGSGNSGISDATGIAIADGLQAYSNFGFLPGSILAGIVSDAIYGSTVAPGLGLVGGGKSGGTSMYGDAFAGMSPGQIAQGSAAFSGDNEGSHAADGNNSDAGGYSSGGGEGEAKGGVIHGLSHLGDYSDGGRLLRGPGDGVSDDIPAMIGKKQPARLADGEFVVPARIVSELGNGSTEAGARKLYAMMDRIQANRKKTMGRGKQFAKDSKADRYLPA